MVSDEAWKINIYSICLKKTPFQWHCRSRGRSRSRSFKRVQCTNYFEIIPFSLIHLKMNADSDEDDRIRKVIQHQRQINVQASGFGVVLYVYSIPYTCSRVSLSHFKTKIQRNNNNNNNTRLNHPIIIRSIFRKEKPHTGIRNTSIHIYWTPNTEH